MALMFSRLAHNFAKNGYYPTHEPTIQVVLDRLDVEPVASVRVFDPCCGEGTALAEVKQHLQELGSDCQSIGIELNEERADHSKTILDYCIHSDIEDTIFPQGGVGLVFLNPPYGLKNKDSETLEKSQRLEEIFYKKAFPALQQGGIMVLIVPSQSITERFAAGIASGLVDISVGKAPERQFNQVVIMGKRLQKKFISRDMETQQQALILSHASAPVWEPLQAAEDPLPETIVYSVPACGQKPFKPVSLKPDAIGLAKDFGQTGTGATLWPVFDRVFPKNALKEKRLPLCSLGQWHTALALAAGQVTGIVNSNDGSRQLLIKGRTYKEQKISSREDGDRVISERIDRFVPTIKAIDVTAGSDLFGEIITIS